MLSKDRTIIKHKGFEVICYPETLQKYRQNQLTAEKTYIIPTIFKNSTKGDVANSADIKKAFNTSDQTQCLLTILNKGTYNLTTKEMRQLKEQKRREIIHYIHNNFLNPQTKYPWSLSVIETSLKESKMPIDHTRSAESQFEKFRSKFVSHLPLKKIETVTGILLIPYTAWNKKGVQSYIRTNATITREDYIDKGISLEISLNQKQFDSFNTKLCHLTDKDFTFVSLDEAKKMASQESTTKYKPKSKRSKSGKRSNILG